MERGGSNEVQDGRERVNDKGGIVARSVLGVRMGPRGSLRRRMT